MSSLDDKGLGNKVSHSEVDFTNKDTFVGSTTSKDMLNDLSLKSSEIGSRLETMTAEIKHIETTVPIKGKVILGPLSRYKWYGIPPWKFIIHLTLVVLASVIAFTFNQTDFQILDPQRVAYFSRFLTTELDNYQQLTAEYDKINVFYKIEDLIEKIKKSVETYYSFEDPETNAMISHINITSDLFPDKIHPNVTFRFKDEVALRELKKRKVFYFDLYKDDLNIFKDKAATKEMLQLCDEMVINYTVFANYTGQLDDSGFNLYKWTILQKFDLSNPSLVTMKLDVQHQVLHETIGNHFEFFQIDSKNDT